MIGTFSNYCVHMVHVLGKCLAWLRRTWCHPCSLFQKRGLAPHANSIAASPQTAPLSTTNRRSFNARTARQTPAYVATEWVMTTISVGSGWPHIYLRHVRSNGAVTIATLRCYRVATTSCLNTARSVVRQDHSYVTVPTAFWISSGVRFLYYCRPISCSFLIRRSCAKTLLLQLLFPDLLGHIVQLCWCIFRLGHAIVFTNSIIKMIRGAPNVGIWTQAFQIWRQVHPLAGVCIKPLLALKGSGAANRYCMFSNIQMTKPEGVTTKLLWS